jgi:hypothetical protein
LQTNLPRRTSTLRDPTLSTLSHLDAKYNSASGPGKQQQHATQKVKVFDDDLSEDEDEERIFAGEDGLDGSGSEDEDEGDDDEESGDEDEDDDEDEEDDDEEDDESENNDSHPITRRSLPAKTNTTTAATGNGNGTAKLDPVAAIRASKSKEVEKGRAILRQQVRPRSLMLLSLTVLPRSLKGRPGADQSLRADGSIETIRRPGRCQDLIRKGLAGG